MSPLVDLRDGIVSTLSAEYPALAACAAIPGRLTPQELTRLAPTAPSVLVALLRSKRGAEVGSGHVDIRVRAAAYIVAALGDETTALQMAAEIGGLVPFETWGKAASGVQAALPTIKVKNLHTALTAGQNLTVWSVTWWQPVRLGQDAWEFLGTMPDTVYVPKTPGAGSTDPDAYEVVAQDPNKGTE